MKRSRFLNASHEETDVRWIIRIPTRTIAFKRGIQSARVTSDKTFGAEIDWDIPRVS